MLGKYSSGDDTDTHLLILLASGVATSLALPGVIHPILLAVLTSGEQREEDLGWIVHTMGGG